MSIKHNCNCRGCGAYIEALDDLHTEHDETAETLAGPTGTSGEWSSMDTAAWAKQRMAELAAKDAEIARLRALLTSAECPVCDGSGAYHGADGGMQQCQWCDEKHAALSEPGAGR